jgi:dipeptidyl aminopeptidase/acylaminoacyl peptidase
MRFKSAFMLALAMLASTAAAQTTPVKTPRPVGDFAKLPFFDNPVLSPDGRKVAARIAVNGKQVFAIVPLTREAKPALISAGENDLLDWGWAGNDWLAARIGGVAPIEGQSIYFTRIAGVSADGKTVKPIDFEKGGQSADVIWAARDGTPRALIVRQRSWFLDQGFWPDVSMVDLSTGKARDVVGGRASVMRWFADPTGVVRMGIGYSDTTREARLLYRESENAAFATVDRAKRRNDESLTIPIFRAGGLPPITMATTDGFDTVNELDMKTLTVGRSIWRTEGYDVDSVIIHPTNGVLEGVLYTSDRSRVHWLDPKLAEVQTLLDKAVGERIASITSMSDDRSRLLVHVAAAGQPGAYFYYDAVAGGAMNRLAWINETIKGARLGTMSAFRYKARDGLSIEAILTVPAGREARNLPLILMPHGGPEARDTVSYDWWAQFLADRGYAVVQPNYRGSTGYGEAFLKAGDGNWGTKMQDDLNDAVDDLAKRGVIDPKRVCIIGASYGGYAAMRGAQRDGARYRCAVSYAGVSDLRAMLSYDGRFLNGRTSADGWKSSAANLDEVSPINGAASLSTPILIMHGKKDLRVPVSQSRRMVDRLRDAGKPVEYVEQPLGDHHFSREDDRRTFLEAIERFLKQHNPA